MIKPELQIAPADSANLHLTTLRANVLLRCPGSSTLHHHPNSSQRDDRIAPAGNQQGADPFLSFEFTSSPQRLKIAAFFPHTQLNIHAIGEKQTEPLLLDLQQHMEFWKRLKPNLQGCLG